MKRVAEALVGERALLDSAVRADPIAVEGLLHPDFAERGQSGLWWTRDEILRSLTTEAHDYEPVEVRELLGHEVANGVVLVTYVSVRGGHAVGRSSLWLENCGRMRVRWHQGTPIPSHP